MSYLLEIYPSFWFFVLVIPIWSGIGCLAIVLAAICDRFEGSGCTQTTETDVKEALPACLILGPILALAVIFFILYMVFVKFVVFISNRRKQNES